MSTYRATPVFFDPDKKRWPRLRRGVFLTGLILSSLFGVLIFSILINPLLPQLHLPQSSLFGKGTRAPTAPIIETPEQSRLRETKQKLDVERRKREAARHPRKQPHASTNDQLDIGFYVSWDESSMSSLKENIKNLDVVIGEFLQLHSADGSLIEESQKEGKNPDGPGE